MTGMRRNGSYRCGLLEYSRSSISRGWSVVPATGMNVPTQRCVRQVSTPRVIGSVDFMPDASDGGGELVDGVKVPLFALWHGVTEIGDVLPGSVEDSAAQAKKYGLGMEFELSIGASAAADRFYKYLHTGYSTGCMDGGMMMIYQGVDDLFRCAGSHNGSDERTVYDLLYLYTKDRFTSEAPVVDTEDRLIVIKTDSRSSDFVTITDPDSTRTSWSIVDAVATEGLNYVLEGEGFYLVNTKGTAPGKYSVSFNVSDGYNVSERATLEFLVIDKELPELKETLEEVLQVYARPDQNASSVEFPAGTEITYIALGDGWGYVTAKQDGKTVKGFTNVAFGEETETSVPETSSSQQPREDSGFPIAIVIVIAVVVLAIAVVLVILLKKKNKK